MFSLLDEFGTFEQKKYAIRMKYAELIAKAESEAQKKLLQNQMNAKLKDVDTQAIETNIDWEMAMGGFGGLLTSVMEPELERLKAYIKTDEFKEASAESKEVLLNAIDKLEATIGDKGQLNFKQLGADISVYQTALKEKNDAITQEIEAYSALAEAQATYDAAMKDGTEEQKKTASEQLETAKTNAEQASVNVQTTTDVAKQASNNVKNTATLLDNNLKSMVSGLQSITSGSLSGILSGIDEFGKMGGKFGDAFGKFAEKLDKVPIIGWIVAIIDVFKDGLSEVIGAIIDGVLGAVGGILTDILTLDFIQVIAESLWSGLKEIANALTFGLFNFGESAKKVIEETNQKQAEYNQKEALAQYEINSLYRERYEWAKLIGETELENARRSQAEAKKQLSQNEQEQAELLKKLQGEQYITGYSTKRKGWFGQKRETVTHYDSLAGKSFEEIEKLAISGKLTEEATGYYEALKKAREEGADINALIAESYEKEKELVAGLSFDDAVNQAMDDLMDGTISAAEAYGKIMKNAAQNMLKELMNDDMRAWYDGFAEAGLDGYTEEEKEYWKNRWEQMQADNEQRKEDVENATGVDFDSTSSSSDTSMKGAVKGVSEETAGMVAGQMNAIRINQMESTNILRQHLLQLSAIVQNTSYNKHLLDIRNDINAMRNSGGSLRSQGNATF